MIKTKVCTFPIVLSGTSSPVRFFVAKHGHSLEELEVIDLTGARIKADFKSEANAGRVAFTFDTEDNSIQITNAVAGEFKFNEKLISVCEGTYCADVLIKFPDTTVKLLFQAIQPVNKSTTQFP